MASSIGAKGSAPEFSRVAPGLAHSRIQAPPMLSKLKHHCDLLRLGRIRGSGKGIVEPSPLQFKGSGNRHIVHLAGGDHAKARQIAVVIEQQVQLDRTLGRAKLRPIVHLQTQVDHGGIQAHQFVLEAELLRPLRPGQRQLGLKACEQHVKHILIQLPGSMLVHVRQGRSGERFNAQMRELAFAAPQTLLDLPQAVGTSQLAEEHRYELLPAAHSPRMPFGVELAHFALKVRARNKLEYLTEQAAKSVHVEPFCRMPKRSGKSLQLTWGGSTSPPNLDDSDMKYGLED